VLSREWTLEINMLDLGKNRGGQTRSRKKKGGRKEKTRAKRAEKKNERYQPPKTGLKSPKKKKSEKVFQTKNGKGPRTVIGIDAMER